MFIEKKALILVFDTQENTQLYRKNSIFWRSILF